MVQQYLEIKDQYPDAILFFRMGDFYEMFFEDAKTAARALSITLTSRNKNDPEPIPMCGVPHHSARNYVARLIDQGHKVAICDQVEDPGQAKGLVRREVVQVVTPGMVVDDSFLEAKANTYVAAVARKGKQLGIACMDVSTGEFRATMTDSMEAVVQEVARVAPKEVLLPESLAADGKAAALMERVRHLAVTEVEDEQFETRRGREALCDQFDTHSIEGFGLQDMPAAVAAAGAVLGYVRAAQKQTLSHVTRITPYSLDNYLWLDENTTRNLELLANMGTGKRQGSLLDVLDKTVTAMGGRLLRQWTRYPLMDPQAINERLDAVGEARDQPVARENIREALTSVYDLERLRTRISMGRANARDLLSVKESLKRLPALWTELGRFSSALFADSEVLGDELADVAALIEEAVDDDAPQAIREGGIIKPGYHEELDELRDMAGNAKGWIASMEAKEREKLGINSIKVRYNKVFGYYIEVPKTHSDAVPPGYHRKQTLVNAERYITDELKEYETRVLGAEERAAALEFELFTDLVHRVADENHRLLAASGYLARADALCALAHVADHNGYCRPEVSDDGRLEIHEGRHPVVEQMVAAGRFVENDILMDMEQNQVMIITGPNMAGKSTILRQAALSVVMAQMGSFVPAKSAAVGIVDRIFTRVGALDNLSAGQSTFMVEMQETANILNNATPRSMVVLDEIGRGTSTFDGMSLAWAVAEYLHELDGLGVKTLFATHYHELTDLAQTLPRVVNYNVAVNEWRGEIMFLHKLEPGGTNRSYGIAVARLAGIPRNVLKRAKQVLARVEDMDAERTRNEKRVREPDPGQVQLSLFPTPAELVAQTLTGLDIDHMTPVEALSMLAELQEKICPGAGSDRRNAGGG